MAVQDNLDYLLYVSEGGKMSFTEWMNAGKPPASGGTTGTPVTPSTPTSPNVSGSVTPAQPPAPTYNPNTRDDYTDPYADDIAAAEKQAQQAGQAATGGVAGGGFTDNQKYHDAEGNTWYYDTRGEKIDTGYDPKYDTREKKPKVDPGLSNPTRMPTTPPPAGFHWEWDGVQWQPIKDKEGEKRQKKSRQPGAPDKYTDAYGRIWTWDDYEGYQETGYDKAQDTRLTEKDKGFPQPQGEVPTDKYGRKATWDADDGEWRYPPDWDVDPKGEEKGAAERAAKEAEDKRRFEIEQRRVTEEQTFRQQQAQQSSDQFWRQFDYQAAQDAARAQAEKEARLANLRQSPASWLQYSLEANQTPVIQPWQKPLMPQQYGNLNVGQPIPGWQGLNQGSANLPELTTPSTQYFARIGPTAQQQWGGYQQMQSGAPVEESMFRLQAQSAPGGRNRGLSWLR